MPSLRALAREHDVVAVLTREPSPVGRKRVITPTPVASAAAELGLPVIERDRPDADTAAEIESLQADLGVVVAYGALLKRRLLDAPTAGWINLHFSALPQYRGAAPLQRTIIDGGTEAGLTVFQLVEAMDAGDVIAQSMSPLGADETAGAALTRLASEGVVPVLEAVAQIADGTAVMTPQTGAVTHAAKLTRADGLLDFGADAVSVYARFRGVTPEPGAWVDTPDGVVKILEMRLGSDCASAEPGSVTLDGTRACAGTADGCLELLRVQPAGKGAMDAAAWLRGRGGSVRLTAGVDR